MKKLALALVAGGGLLFTTASSALAVLPSPTSEAAQLIGQECANPSGLLTHGTYVSFVARSYPTDPVHCLGDPPFGD